MTDTETKHDGYAVFDPDGRIYLSSVRATCADTIDTYTGAFSWERNYLPRGWTVRPVTITEVKDDE